KIGGRIISKLHISDARIKSHPRLSERRDQPRIYCGEVCVLSHEPSLNFHDGQYELNPDRNSFHVQRQAGFKASDISTWKRVDISDPYYCLIISRQVIIFLSDAGLY